MFWASKYYLLLKRRHLNLKQKLNKLSTKQKATGNNLSSMKARTCILYVQDFGASDG